MLGDGIVSFGVADVTHDCTNRKSAAKIGSSTQELDVTIDPNGVALKEFVLKK